jgi:Spy/CpxP family protein refolding chaperone
MKTHRILGMMALAAALAATSPASAQELGQKSGYDKGQGKGKGKGMVKGRGRRGDDMGLRGPVGQDLMQYLYPVDLIRHYSTDIDLTNTQIEKIHKLMTDVSDEVERLKWDLEKEAQKLVDLVKAGASKEKIYSQMDRIFKVENKIKKKHLGLMIVIRDVLAKEQREFLDNVKAESGNQISSARDFLGPPPPLPNPPPPPPGP